MTMRTLTMLLISLSLCRAGAALAGNAGDLADDAVHRYRVTFRQNAGSGVDVARAYGTVESWNGLSAVVLTSAGRAEMMKIDPRIESVTEQSARPALTKSPRSAPYSWDIAYDGSGNIKSMGVDSYLYDSLGRLTQASSNGTANRQDYSYDAFGNRTAATRISGSAACVGNTACDQLLVNLKLMGHPIYGPRDMSKLVRFVQLSARVTGHQLPVNYPVAGSDAFRTATGVHAAAIIKAQRKGDHWLADRIYSGVPAGEFGKEQEIEIGPLSGLSNVKHWLARHEIPADEPLAKAVLARAKASNRTLTESEVAQIVREVRS